MSRVFCVNVINSYVHMIIEDVQGIEGAPLCKVFESINWSCLVREHVMKWSESIAAKINDQLRTYINYKFLVFPLVMPNTDDLPGASLSHHTCLVLDIETSEWKHYNSMLHSSSVHFKHALLMKNHVEKCLFEQNKEIEFSQFKVYEVQDTPQQDHNSLDSGVFMLIIIERLLKGDKNLMSYISKEDICKYRAEIIRKYLKLREENAKLQFQV